MLQYACLTYARSIHNRAHYSNFSLASLAALSVDQMRNFDVAPGAKAADLTRKYGISEATF
jgi:hypothetical protein